MTDTPVHTTGRGTPTGMEEEHVKQAWCTTLLMDGKPKMRRAGVWFGLCGMLWAVVLAVGTVGLAAEPTANHAPVPGVEYQRLEEDGTQRIHVVSFDSARKDLMIMATVGEGVWGNETVISMVTHLPAAWGLPVAAINGDYFQMGGVQRYLGTVQGMCIVNGEMVASPPASAFWLDAKGQPHLGRVKSRLAVVWPDGSETPFSVNCSTRDFTSEVRAADVVLYTPWFGPSTRTAPNAREWVLQRATPDGRWLPLAADGVYTARVARVLRTGDAAIPREGMVLSVANTATAKTPDLAVGDLVTLRTACDPDMTGVRTAISGDPMLLAGSKLLTNPAVTNRAPRTAVGLAGTKVWFVVVEGRQPPTALGMSHHELATFMQRLGCTEAMNLDGGGSSTLWYQGKAVNLASGNGRPVGNALVLMQKPK